MGAVINPAVHIWLRQLTPCLLMAHRGQWPKVIAPTWTVPHSGTHTRSAVRLREWRYCGDGALHGVPQHAGTNQRVELPL